VAQAESSPQNSEGEPPQEPNEGLTMTTPQWQQVLDNMDLFMATYNDGNCLFCGVDLKKETEHGHFCETVELVAALEILQEELDHKADVLDRVRAALT
jgi:hypothetical protein